MFGFIALEQSRSSLYVISFTILWKLHFLLWSINFNLLTTSYLCRILFWSDLGKHPRIERASMDGLKRQVVIDSNQLTWPNGLTIDYTSDRIFWADSKRDYIGSSNLDGSDIITVAKNVHNPYSLTVFEDSIYWANRKTGKIFRTSKSTGSITQEFEIQFYSPVDVQIMHPSLQEAGDNLSFP